MTDIQKKMLMVAGALFALALVAFLWRTFGGTRVGVESPNGQQGQVQGSTTPVEELTIPLAPVTLQQTEVQKNRNMTAFAMQFVERHGSYSTEGNFQNLRDLIPSMTDAMRRRSEQIMNAGVAAGAEFYGITTQSLAVRVEESNTVMATVVVSARRTEVRGVGAGTSFNQDARLQLVKMGDEWLVDSLEWLPRM